MQKLHVSHIKGLYFKHQGIAMDSPEPAVQFWIKARFMLKNFDVFNFDK